MKPKSARAAVVALSGLRSEARIAAGSAVWAIAGAQCVAELEHTLATRFGHARAIISFGIAGGLAPSCMTGTIVVARRVVAPRATWTTDEAWSAAIAACVPDAIRADIAGSDFPVLTASAKERLWIDTGAVAVDTESHVAAKAAAALGVPLAVFRVVADAADQSLPNAALVAVRADGTIDLRAVLRSVSRSPGQIPQLVRTGIDTRTALRALARGRERLGAGLRYPDLGELLLDVS